MENENEKYVPLYYDGGVTIGRARFSPDMKTITIELNEGAEIGAAMRKGLLGLNTIQLISNDAANA